MKYSLIMSITQLTSQYFGDEPCSGQGSLGTLLEDITILLRDSMICKLFERQIGSYLILELLVIKVMILKRYLFGQKCFLILTTTLVWIVVDDIQLLNSLWPHGLQHTRLPCLSRSPGVCSNSCLLVGDAIQPSHPLSSPSPPVFNLSQHQSLF